LVTDHSVFQINSLNPDQTQRIGASIGELARAGDLILLTGDLGAGKTCLTQGIGWGTGFEGYTASPSFVLVREYRGRIPLYHIDLYRLDNIEEIAELGIDDYTCSEGVCVIEWADKALDYFPTEHLCIRLDCLGENERQLSFNASGNRYRDLMEQLKHKWNLP